MPLPTESPRVFSNILCPIDFSDPSRAALQVASDLAKDWAVRMTVLYVHDPTMAGMEVVAFPGVSLDDLRAEVRNFAGKVLPAGPRSGPPDTLRPSATRLRKYSRPRRSCAAMSSSWVRGV